MTDLVTRVNLIAALATAVLTAPAAWLGGLPGAVGLTCGGALAIGNLWWLSHRTRAHLDRPPLRAWGTAAGLRLSALAAIVAALLASEWAHPLGLVAGLSVLPPALVAAGLRDARLVG